MGRPSVGRGNRNALRADAPKPPTVAPADTAPRDNLPARPNTATATPTTTSSPDAGKSAFIPGGPASVLKEMYAVAQANDSRSIKPFFSKSSATIIEELAKNLGGSEDGRDDPWRNIRNDVGQDELPAIVREEIIGSEARVWIRERNQPTDSQLKFVREDDSWRLDFTEDLKAEVKDLPRRMEKTNDLVKRIPSERDKAEEVLRRSEREMRE